MRHTIAGDQDKPTFLIKPCNSAGPQPEGSPLQRRS